MANLTHDTNWTGSVTQDTASKTYTFATGQKYVDKDIALTVNVSLDGAKAVTGTTSRTSGNGSCSYKDNSNLSVSDTDNGIYIRFDGSGAVSTGTGYITSGSTSSSSATGKKFITGVTVPKDKIFSLTTTADTALDTTSNISITNNAYRQLSITNNANGDVNISGAGRTDFTSGSATTGMITINAYDSATTPALTSAQTIVENGKWKSPTCTSITDNGYYYGRPYHYKTTTANLSAGNIKHGVTIKVGDSADDDRVAGVTGTFYNDGTTYTLSSVGTSIDMGASTSHRYITTSGLQVTPTATYTASGSVSAVDITGYGKLTIGGGVYSASASAGSNFTPTISKQATPSGVTNAASGDATTTAPTSGVYVAVKSASQTAKSITPTATISTAGWIAAGSKTGTAVSVGLNDSSVTYIPITTTSGSKSGGTVSWGTGWITSGSQTVTLSDLGITSRTDSGNVTLNGTTTSKSYAAGYYANAHGATHATVSVPNPTITVSAAGLITASGSWTAGFTTNTSYSNTKQLNATYDSTNKAISLPYGSVSGTVVTV